MTTTSPFVSSLPIPIFLGFSNMIVNPTSVTESNNTITFNTTGFISHSGFSKTWVQFVVHDDTWIYFGANNLPPATGNQGGSVSLLSIGSGRASVGYFYDNVYDQGGGADYGIVDGDLIRLEFTLYNQGVKIYKNGSLILQRDQGFYGTAWGIRKRYGGTIDNLSFGEIS